MFGDIDIRGQGAGAEGSQVNARGAVLARAKKRGYAGGSVQFDAVALAVIKRQGITFVAVAPGQCETGGGIQASAQQTHG